MLRIKFFTEICIRTLVVQADGFAVLLSALNNSSSGTVTIFLDFFFNISKSLYENTICYSGRKEKVRPNRGAV